jgi:NTE family protein
MNEEIEFVKAYTLRSNNKHCCNAQMALTKCKHSEALQEYNLALKDDPTDKISLSGKCYCYRMLAQRAEAENDWLKAIDYCSQAHKLAPNDAAINETLARLRQKHYQAENSRQSFQEGVVEIDHSIAANIENLVFQGGGIKGIGHLGAIRQLYVKYIDPKKLRRIGGTSGGAIVALPICLGASIEEIEKIVTKTDIPSFMDGPYKNELLSLIQNRERVKYLGKGLFHDSKAIKDSVKHPINATAASSHFSVLPSDPDAKAVIRGFKLLNNGDFGLFPGDYFREEFLEPFIQSKTGIPYLTFRELHELSLKLPDQFKDLYVVAVDIETEEIKVLSFETTADVIISDAIRATMSIPLIYKPHILHLKNDGKRVPVPNGHWYMDGGLLDNYPLWLFDRAKYLKDSGLPDNTIIANPNTLGCKLVPKVIKESLEEGNGLPSSAKPDSLAELVWRIITIIKHKQNSDHVKFNEPSRTIYIDHNNINTVEFDLDNAGQKLLQKNGVEAVENFFNRRSLVNDKSTLHYVALHGDITRAEAMLVSGYDGNIVDIDGNSPLDVAINKNNKPLILQLVIKGVYKCKNPNYVESILRKAINNDFVDQKLLTEQAGKFIAYNRIIHDKDCAINDNSTVGLLRGHAF